MGYGYRNVGKILVGKMVGSVFAGGVTGEVCAYVCGVRWLKRLCQAQWDIAMGVKT